MTRIRISENETFETTLRRFSRKIQQEGVLAEARRREHYAKPGVKRKRKEAAKLRKMSCFPRAASTQAVNISMGKVRAFLL